MVVIYNIYYSTAKLANILQTNKIYDGFFLKAHQNQKAEQTRQGFVTSNCQADERGSRAHVHSHPRVVGFSHTTVFPFAHAVTATSMSIIINKPCLFICCFVCWIVNKLVVAKQNLFYPNIWFIKSSGFLA